MVISSRERKEGVELGDSSINVPIRRSVYLISFIVCVITGLGLIDLSLIGDFSGEHADIKGRSIFRIFVYFLPANVVLFFIGIITLFTSLFLYRKLKGGKEAMIISPQGVIVNVAIIKTGLIRWNEIKDFEITKIGSQNCLFINLYNPEALIQQQKLFTRLFVYVNKKLGYSQPISIASTAVKMKLPQLQQHLQDYHYRYKRAN